MPLCPSVPLPECPFTRVPADVLPVLGVVLRQPLLQGPEVLQHGRGVQAALRLPHHDAQRRPPRLRPPQTEHGPWEACVIGEGWSDVKDRLKPLRNVSSPLLDYTTALERYPYYTTACTLKLPLLKFTILQYKVFTYQL